MRIFCAPNAIVLTIDIAIQPEMCFITKKTRLRGSLSQSILSHESIHRMRCVVSGRWAEEHDEVAHGRDTVSAFGDRHCAQMKVNVQVAWRSDVKTTMDFPVSSL